MNPNRSFISSPKTSEDVLKFNSNRYVAALVTKGYYFVYAGYGDTFILDLGKLSSHWLQTRTKVTAH